MAYLLHLGVNLLDNLVGVGACHLVDADVHTRPSIGLTYYIIVLRAKLHTGNVTDAQHVAVGQRTDDKVLIFLFLLVAAPVLQHILERVPTLGT